MITLLVWLVILGVPTVALLTGGWHLQRSGRRVAGLVMLILGGLLAVMAIVVLSGIAV